MEESIFERIEDAKKKNRAFAAWKEPGSKEVKFISAESAITVTINDLKKYNGFTVFPFGRKQGWMIRESEIESKSKKGPVKKERENSFYSKEEYLEIFKKFHSAIRAEKFPKLVLSRIRKQKINKIHAPDYYFRQLCDIYPRAFCYYLHLPGFETWIGATPEVLVNFDSEKIHTISLAGTQQTGKEEWGKKEKEEQSLVTEYIETKIRKYFRKFSRRGPFTTQAGNIVHLKTEFEIIREGKSDIYAFIDSLQPTPAVCGIPKEQALKFILNEERHDRSFYSGFIGYTDKETEGKLYVNLRCFQLREDEVWFYAGGGITADSDGEKEWEETEIKINITAGIFE